MASIHIVIQNKLGLHARAASKFAKTGGRFSSSLKVLCKGKSIDGKSIMSLMLLAASKGTKIEIQANGNDEQEVLDALIELINNKFDEEE